MKTNEIMKSSRKMMNGIAKVEKKFGEMQKSFEIEFDEVNRVGRGFYDYCDLYCPIMKKTFTVAHDGTISPMI